MAIFVVYFFNSSSESDFIKREKKIKMTKNGKLELVGIKHPFRQLKTSTL